MHKTCPCRVRSIDVVLDSVIQQVFYLEADGFFLLSLLICLGKNSTLLNNIETIKEAYYRRLSLFESVEYVGQGVAHLRVFHYR